MTILLKKVATLLSVVLVLLAVVVVTRTARYAYAVSGVEPVAEAAIPSGVAERLAGAIRIPTISHEDSAEFNAQAFKDLHAYLSDVFPRVHANLRREAVGEYSLLYTWQGTNPSLKPMLLMGHLDVVPVESGTESEWQEDPFGGRIDQNFIWGRGAIDNKSAVLGTLEAVEALLAEDFQPTRTVYLAFGHDEEVGGARGAREIASVLRGRGVQLELVLDEGGVIGDGLLPGVSAPIALIGVAEKGFASVELSTRVAGGHSSLPPRETAIGILSAAVARLETSSMPPRFDGATQQLFERVGPLFPISQRVLFANLWLTRPLVTRILATAPATNAMVRTTTAPTIFQAGTKDNVLPTSARAVINFRIQPGDSVAGVVGHVREVVDDDRIDVKIAGKFSAEPSEVSSNESAMFQTLEKSIRKVAPDTVVAPYLVVVVTDARYYSDLTENSFRFLPIRLESDDLKRMHGIDERLGIQEYETAVRIYRQLLIDASRR
ncbi:MAG TPA: M20 family peptidase [Terriglobia bacterium]|nr:M20 family peptidase [Terriglobia bacterium]